MKKCTTGFLSFSSAFSLCSITANDTKKQGGEVFVRFFGSKMGGEGRALVPLPPMISPPNTEREEHWRNFNNSMNAVSMGFVATAILISMFLVMAIFERFFRPRSSQLTTTSRINTKLDCHSPTMTIYAREVSVIMPGEDIPTFIAHPAPAPCPPEGITWPLHQHKPCFNPSTA